MLAVEKRPFALALDSCEVDLIEHPGAPTDFPQLRRNFVKEFAEQFLLTGRVCLDKSS